MASIFISPTGSPTGSGAQLDPVTAKRAASLANPGDFIEVRGGTYVLPGGNSDFFLDVPKSGTEAAPITMRKFEAEANTWTGTGSNLGSPQDFASAFVQIRLNRGWWVFDGLTYDVSTVGKFVIGNESHDIVWRNCSFLLSEDGSVHADRSSFWTFDTCAFDGAGDITDPLDQDSWACLTLRGSHHFLVDACTFARAEHATVDLMNFGQVSSKNYSHSCIFRRCTFDNTLSGGLYLQRGTHDIVVDRCLFKRWGTQKTVEEKVAINLAADHCLIRYNVFAFGSTTKAGEVGTGSRNQSALAFSGQVFGGDGQRVVENRIYNNTYYKVGSHVYKVIQGNGGSDFANGRLGETRNNRVFNDLAYKCHVRENPTSWGNNSGKFYWITETFHADPGNDNQPRNNKWPTFAGGNTWRNGLYHHDDGASTPILAHAGNSKAKGETVLDMAKTLAELDAQFPAAFSDNLDADPKLTNPEAEDFALLPGSPALEAGAFATTTRVAGTNTTVVRVVDALVFSDGLGLVPGDTIQFKGGTTLHTIQSIDRQQDDLHVTPPATYAAGVGVHLPFGGARPDIGARVFSQPLVPQEAPPVTPTPPGEPPVQPLPPEPPEAIFPTPPPEVPFPTPVPETPFPRGAEDEGDDMSRFRGIPFTLDAWTEPRFNAQGENANAEMTADLSGSTDASVAPATTAFNAAGGCDLTSNGVARAARRWEVTIHRLNVPKRLKLTVETGALFVRIGTTAGGSEILADTSKAPGTHTDIEFTPAVSPIFVEVGHTTNATHILRSLFVQDELNDLDGFDVDFIKADRTAVRIRPYITASSPRGGGVQTPTVYVPPSLLGASSQITGEFVVWARDRVGNRSQPSAPITGVVIRSDVRAPESPVLGTASGAQPPAPPVPTTEPTQPAPVVEPAPTTERPATHYVDPVNGSDTNAGTSTTTAWRTLAKALGATGAPSGSVIEIIQPGTQGALLLVAIASGSPTARTELRVKANAGFAFTFTGAGAIRPNTWNDTHLGDPDLCGNHYVDLVRLTFSAVTDQRAVRMSTGWRLIDCLLQTCKEAAYVKGHEVQILRSRFYDISEHWLHGGGEKASAKWLRNLLVKSCDVQRVHAGETLSILNSAVMKLLHTDGTQVEDNTCRECHGPAIWLDAYNFNYGIRRNVIGRSTITTPNDGAGRPFYSAQGIVTEINQGPGVIEDNTVFLMGGSGIGVWESPDVTVRRNTLSECGTHAIRLRNQNRGSPQFAPGEWRLRRLTLVDNKFRRSGSSTIGGSVGSSFAGWETWGLVIDRNTYEVLAGRPFWRWQQGDVASLGGVKAMGFEGNAAETLIPFTNPF